MDAEQIQQDMRARRAAIDARQDLDVLHDAAVPDAPAERPGRRKARWASAQRAQVPAPSSATVASEPRTPPSAATIPPARPCT